MKKNPKKTPKKPKKDPTVGDLIDRGYNFFFIPLDKKPEIVWSFSHAAKSWAWKG